MINYTGIASIVLFYILILAVGMWAARKNTGGGDQEVGEVVRGKRRDAGRTCSLFVTKTRLPIWVRNRKFGSCLL